MKIELVLALLSIDFLVFDSLFSKGFVSQRNNFISVCNTIYQVYVLNVGEQHP